MWAFVVPSGPRLKLPFVSINDWIQWQGMARLFVFVLSLPLHSAWYITDAMFLVEMIIPARRH